MKHALLTLLISMNMISAQQNQINTRDSSIALEGFYDLSEMEMPAKLYLFDTNLFHYYAMFGSVDLEIYGEYKIEENEIHFYPQKEQLQPYIVYGRANLVIQDFLTFNYYSPDEYGQKVFLSVDDEWSTSTQHRTNGEEVMQKVKKRSVKNLTIHLMTQQNEWGTTFKTLESYAAKIPKGTNDFVFSYNRYYEMRKRFAREPLALKGDAIVSDRKHRVKEPLHENEKENITKYIKKNGMFPAAMLSRENEFDKIQLIKMNNKQILKISKIGEIVEE